MELNINVEQVRKWAREEPTRFRSWKDRMREEAVVILPVIQIVQGDREALQAEQSALEEERRITKGAVRCLREETENHLKGTEPWIIVFHHFHFSRKETGGVKKHRQLQLAIEEGGKDIANIDARLAEIGRILQNLNTSLQ